MLHKTLETFYSNMPYSDSQEHPDGQLWLITMDDWENIPKGTIIENCKTGKVTRYDGTQDGEHLTYGIRGYR